MKPLRQLSNKTKLCGGTLLAFALGALASGWLLGQPDAIARSGKVAGAEAGAFAFLGLGLAAAFLLGLWLAAEVARPLRQASALAKRMSDGDLDGKVRVDDAGDAALLLRQLVGLGGRLQSTMRELHDGTRSLAQGSGEIAQASQDLSARTEQQAAALEETASSMEELTATVKQNADHAHEASKLAVTASEVAVKGGAVVSEVVGTMASINESSKRIAEIIGVIDGIAFQTNILALNAAVEAARAGEQGRGFAVVASEVRSLAQRSAAAAREIKELIDDSVEKVNAGTLLADKAGNTMNEVVASVKRVTGIIGEIADASAEQTSGIDQVNQAIAAMDQATQQNAALVEQSAAAAAGMREQAGTLTRLVDTFGRQAPAATPGLSLPVPGDGAPPAPPLARPQPTPAQQARVPRRPRNNTQPAPESEWEEF